MSKRIKAGGITLPEFKLYYKPIVIKNTVVLEKKLKLKWTHPQWTGIESLEMSPSMYDQLIYDKDVNNKQWQKIVSWINDVGESWIFTYRRTKLDPYLTPYAKVNSKCIEDLSVKTRNCKTTRRKLREKAYWHLPGQWFFWIWHHNDIGQAIKIKMDKWDCIKLKLCIAEKTVNRVKKQPTECEKIFANHTFHKKLIFKIYKELI